MLGVQGARQAGMLGGARAWRAGGMGAGLALGSALGALGPFSIRFDSFFFLSQQMNTVHCKINFFQKKKIFLNSNKIKKILIKFSKNKIFKNKIFENKILLKTIF